MVNPSKKRQNEHTYGDLRKKIKKSKKSRVIVKEELNTEIQLNEPTTVSTLAEEVPVEVIPQESAISTQPSQGTSGAIMVPEATSNQLVIRDKNLPPLPPVSSLLLFTPSIEANKFDPFYQTVNTYVQHVLPNPMVNDSHPKETVKHEQGQTTPVIRQTMMDLNALPLMPIIPYYFHHEQFGIEACMHQLQQQRKKTGTIIGYTNTVPNGTNYYYHV
ncbi:hypothetical protein V8B55DRAFT_1140161 [Mucor lusitanicus]|uniref:Uncharacterized protein n=2 Tax=Mucor circinelloides f. lusitanicus TaxID=29924 RepID=A0A162YQA8_MUCCL|nr:hypothetical protein FB192DRAFT_1121748 [Mucor lusitanicus]OAC99996.1 hypothetical protein MUCCIDRAFT_83627 [Mucor lusitanicus CBS 277.49]